MTAPEKDGIYIRTFSTALSEEQLSNMERAKTKPHLLDDETIHRVLKEVLRKIESENISEILKK